MINKFIKINIRYVTYRKNTKKNETNKCQISR